MSIRDRFREIKQTLDHVHTGIKNVGIENAVRTVLYRPRRLWWQVCFGGVQSPPGEFDAGDVLSVEEISSGLCLHLDHAVFTLQALTPESVRVRIVAGDEMPDYFSYATQPQMSPAHHFSWQESDELIHFDTDAMKITVRKHPFGFSWQDGSGQLAGGSTEMLEWRKAGAFFSQHFDAETTWYGLGERAFHLALEPRTYHLTTIDPEVYGPNDDPLYINIPFLLGVRGGKAFGLLFDRMSDGVLTLRQDGGIDYHIQGNEVRLDIILGPGPADVLARYADLTGHAPLPPLWALGYHQSRWSYENEAIVRDIASNFRNRQIPCDAIHFDIDYMDGFRCFTWNHDAFPDPKGLISELHQDGFRAVGMIDPGIKVDPDYDVCVDGVANDVFCKLPDGSLFHGPVWPGECYFPDFTSPRVRKWWGKWYRRLLDVGFDGFWNDMNEPTIFGRSTFSPAVQHDLEGRGAAHWQVHSAYGMQMVRATFEGLNDLRPDHRNWVFTRSAYAGAQRYASCWTADNGSTWADLQITPAMLMNLGLSGMAFTGSDIGGFAGAPTPELYARWISMGAFQPFFRTHTIKNSPWQEPWRYGEEVEAISRKYITLRYRLLPAIYTLFWQYATRGTPMMRPMFFEDPADEAFLLLDDQWLFGDHLLVAPALEENMTSRQVLLPAGDWYDFWTDERLLGKKTVTRQAPLAVVPLYVRAGAVLPMGPAQQFTGEKPTAPLALHLYPGSGVSWLYEDDGETLAYHSGYARTSRFEMKKTFQGLILERQVTGDYTPAYTKIQIIFHYAEISHATLDGRPLSVLNNQVEINNDPWQQLIATFS